MDVHNDQRPPAPAIDVVREQSGSQGDGSRNFSKDAPRNKLSRRRAIRERCLHCTARSTKEVAQCLMATCSLYPYRMSRGKQNPGARTRAIRAYRLWCCSSQPKEVRLCQNEECPLHPFRMGKTDRQNAPLLQKNDIYGGNFDGRTRDEEIHPEGEGGLP